MANLVDKALQQWQETRSSDKKLIMAVWYLQDPDYDKDFKTFFKERAIPPETIRRRRQTLQSKGLYKATQSVEDLRYELFKQNRWSRGSVVAEEIR